MARTFHIDKVSYTKEDSVAISVKYGGSGTYINDMCLNVIITSNVYSSNSVVIRINLVVTEYVLDYLIVFDF